MTCWSTSPQPRPHFAPCWTPDTRYWIPVFVSRTWIPDSNLLVGSGFLELYSEFQSWWYHTGETRHLPNHWYSYWMCQNTVQVIITVIGLLPSWTNAHLTFFCRTYFDSSSRRLVTKSHQSQSCHPAVRPISWTSDFRLFSKVFA